MSDLYEPLLSHPPAPDIPDQIVQVTVTSGATATEMVWTAKVAVVDQDGLTLSQIANDDNIETLVRKVIVKADSNNSLDVDVVIGGVIVVTLDANQEYLFDVPAGGVFDLRTILARSSIEGDSTVHINYLQ